MAKSEIKLQYSGLIIFAAKILSVATGLIFQFMLARATTIKEYGVWFNINDVATYFALLASVLPFWTMRFVIRRKEGAVKTGALANLLIAAIATAIYIPLVPIIMALLKVSGTYTIFYFIFALQIIETYSIMVMEACLQARMPQAVGYGLLIAQVSKIIFAYIFIVVLQQPLLGAAIGLMAGLAVQITYYFKLLLEEFRQKVRWSYLKEWLKGSVANIYNVMGNQLANYIFIMLFAYGGEDARSNYGAAAQIANVIAYSSFLAFALYPKLLAERKSEDVTTSIKMVLMFAIPMAVGASVLAQSYVIMLNPIYADAAPVLVVLAVDGLVLTLSGLFGSVLYGVEKVDEKATISFKALAKSKLFIAFSLPYFHSAITIPTAFYVLTTFAQNHPVQAALYVSIINLVARFTMFLILYFVVRKMIKIHIPWRTIAKYVSAAVVMGTILFLIPHPTRISTTLGATAIGGLVYIGLLMAIDKETRELAISVWRETKGRLGLV